MDTINVQESEVCTYTFHDNGIHEFILLQPTPRGVDELVKRINALYDTTTPGQLLRELIEFRGGLPPISYAMQRAREQLARYPNMPRIRAVIMYDSNLFISFVMPLANILFSRFNSISVKYMPTTKREAAFAWLLQDK
jgi:hypothetical protein